MKWDRFLHLALVLAGIALCVSCARQNPGDLLQTYMQAYNRHDVEKVLSLLADDVVFVLDGKTFSGKEGVRNIAQFDSVLNVRLDFRDYKVIGDTMIFRAIERNDWLQMVGIGEIDCWPCKAIAQHGLFKWVSIKRTRESAIQYGRAIESMGAWAAKDNMQDFEEMIRSEYTKEGAQKCMALTRQWLQEIKN